MQFDPSKINELHDEFHANPQNDDRVFWKAFGEQMGFRHPKTSGYGVAKRIREGQKFQRLVARKYRRAFGAILGRQVTLDEVKLVSADLPGSYEQVDTCESRKEDDSTSLIRNASERGSRV